MTPYQQGQESYYTLKYLTPIHALSEHFNKLNKDDRFEFAKGFKDAQKLLE